MEIFSWLNYDSCYCHSCLLHAYWYRCVEFHMAFILRCIAVYWMGTLLPAMHKECSTYGSSGGSSMLSMFVFSIYVIYDYMQQTIFFLFLLCQLLPEVMPACSLCETLLCQRLGQWCLVSALLFTLWSCSRPFHCRCALHGVLLCFLDSLLRGSMFLTGHLCL